jgi:hypothetical protein
MADDKKNPDGSTRSKIGASKNTKPRRGDGTADLLAKQLNAQENAKAEAKKQSGKNTDYYTTRGASGKPTRHRLRTGTVDSGPSKYEIADSNIQKGLGQLISEKLMSGQSLGKSILGGGKTMAGAVGTNIKKAFDPMMMLSKLPGGLGQVAATMYGMKAKRSMSDITYATGIPQPDMEDVETKVKSGRPKVESKASKVSGGSMPKGAVGVLNKIYKLLATKIDEDKRLQEIKANFDKEKKDGDDKKHKELIDTLKGLGGKNKPEEKKDDEKKGGILSFLGEIIADIIGMKLLKSLNPFKNLGSFGSKAANIGGPARDPKTGRFVKAAAPKSFGSSVVKGIKSVGSKAASLGKSAVQGVGKGLGVARNFGSGAAKGLDTTKSALLQSVEKSGASVAQTASKVSKVGGLLKGGTKLLGFLKSIPGLSVIAGGVDLITRVSELNGQLDSGAISKEEYKKGIVSAVGAVAGGSGGAALLGSLGAAAGSIVPGVGTIIGGLGGGILGYMGGEKVGGWLGGKLYDFFVDNKKESATSVKAPTASSVPTQASASLSTTKDVPFASTKITTPASPMSATPNQLGARVTAASMENRNLTGPTSDNASAPVIINAPKTTNISNGNQGGDKQALNVRNDDSVLNRLQYQNYRPV